MLASFVPKNENETATTNSSLDSNTTFDSLSCLTLNGSPVHESEIYHFFDWIELFGQGLSSSIDLISEVLPIFAYDGKQPVCEDVKIAIPHSKYYFSLKFISLDGSQILISFDSDRYDLEKDKSIIEPKIYAFKVLMTGSVLSYRYQRNDFTALFADLHSIFSAIQKYSPTYRKFKGSRVDTTTEFSSSLCLDLFDNLDYVYRTKSYGKKLRDKLIFSDGIGASMQLGANSSPFQLIIYHCGVKHDRDSFRFECRNRKLRANQIISGCLEIYRNFYMNSNMKKDEFNLYMLHYLRDYNFNIKNYNFVDLNSKKKGYVFSQFKELDWWRDLKDKIKIDRDIRYKFIQPKNSIKDSLDWFLRCGCSFLSRLAKHYSSAFLHELIDFGIALSSQKSRKMDNKDIELTRIDGGLLGLFSDKTLSKVIEYEFLDDLEQFGYDKKKDKFNDVHEWNYKKRKDWNVTNDKDLIRKINENRELNDIDLSPIDFARNEWEKMMLIYHRFVEVCSTFDELDFEMINKSFVLLHRNYQDILIKKIWQKFELIYDG